MSRVKLSDNGQARPISAKHLLQDKINELERDIRLHRAARTLMQLEEAGPLDQIQNIVAEFRNKYHKTPGSPPEYHPPSVRVYDK